METLEMIINNIAEECNSNGIKVKCINDNGLIGVVVLGQTVKVTKHEYDGEVVYGISNTRPEGTDIPELLSEIIGRNIAEGMM